MRRRRGNIDGPARHTVFIAEPAMPDPWCHLHPGSDLRQDGGPGIVDGTSQFSEIPVRMCSKRVLSSDAVSARASSSAKGFALIVIFARLQPDPLEVAVAEVSGNRTVEVSLDL